MYINNALRDQVYKNNLLHGFWDNNRTYKQFVDNLFGEFEEVTEELWHHSPTEVYTKDGVKPEGVPTELADIIIFILDYFGGSNPKIDIDEEFLLEPDKYYKNEEWYALKRQKEAREYFIEIADTARNYISLSFYDNFMHGNEEFIGDDGETHSTPKELHKVIKLILEFCDIYRIDMEKELIAKINYNNLRPRNYRKIGSPELEETAEDKVYDMAVAAGYGLYKEVDKIISEREKINAEILRRRAQKRELEAQEQEQKATKKK